MKSRILAVAAIAVACTAGLAYAADAPMVTTPDQVKWGPAPNSLPAGAQLAVMAGDPAATGFVSLRVKMPAGYTIKPHYHPTDEHVTVLSGSMHFAMGDTMDPAMETAAGPGGYFMVKAQAHHYAVAQADTEIQIDLIGPFKITYVNPADDPRGTSKMD